MRPDALAVNRKVNSLASGQPSCNEFPNDTISGVNPSCSLGNEAIYIRHAIDLSSSFFHLSPPFSRSGPFLWPPPLARSFLAFACWVSPGRARISTRSFGTETAPRKDGRKEVELALTCLYRTENRCFETGKWEITASDWKAEFRTGLTLFLPPRRRSIRSEWRNLFNHRFLRHYLSLANQSQHSLRSRHMWALQKRNAFDSHELSSLYSVDCAAINRLTYIIFNSFAEPSVERIRLCLRTKAVTIKWREHLLLIHHSSTIACLGNNFRLTDT